MEIQMFKIFVFQSVSHVGVLPLSMFVTFSIH
jgi:hypothetical protein